MKGITKKLLLFSRPENIIIVFSIIVSFGRNKLLTYLISANELDNILYLNYILICIPNILSLGLLVQIPQFVRQKKGKSSKYINIYLNIILLLSLILSPLFFFITNLFLDIPYYNIILLFVAIVLNFVLVVKILYLSFIKGSLLFQVYTFFRLHIWFIFFYLFIILITNVNLSLAFLTSSILSSTLIILTHEHKNQTQKFHFTSWRIIKHIVRNTSPKNIFGNTVIQNYDNIIGLIIRHTLLQLYSNGSLLILNIFDIIANYFSSVMNNKFLNFFRTKETRKYYFKSILQFTVIVFLALTPLLIFKDWIIKLVANDTYLSAGKYIPFFIGICVMRFSINGILTAQTFLGNVKKYYIPTSLYVSAILFCGLLQDLSLYFIALSVIMGIYTSFMIYKIERQAY